MRNADNGEVVHVAGGQGVRGDSLFLSCNFVVNLKTALKKPPFFFLSHSISCEKHIGMLIIAFIVS